MWVLPLQMWTTGVIFCHVCNKSLTEHVRLISYRRSKYGVSIVCSCHFRLRWTANKNVGGHTQHSDSMSLHFQMTHLYMKITYVCVCIQESRIIWFQNYMFAVHITKLHACIPEGNLVSRVTQPASLSCLCYCLGVTSYVLSSPSD